jgi:hypothetical protein
MKREITEHLILNQMLIGIVSKENSHFYQTYAADSSLGQHQGNAVQISAPWNKEN